MLDQKFLKGELNLILKAVKKMGFKVAGSADAAVKDSMKSGTAEITFTNSDGEKAGKLFVQASRGKDYLSDRNVDDRIEKIIRTATDHHFTEQDHSMKPTDQQILDFVESAGGIVKVMGALKAGAARVVELTENLTTKDAELVVAAEANEELQSKLEESDSKLGEANTLLESNAAQRKSGKMFAKQDESNDKPLHAHQTASRAMRLIGKAHVTSIDADDKS